jgi:hypothetical protein
MYIPVAGPKPRFTVTVPIQIPEGDIPRIRKWINQANLKHPDAVPDHSGDFLSVYHHRLTDLKKFSLTFEVNWNGTINLATPPH